MKSKQLVCRACGKHYDGCKSINVGSANKWKAIACSTECYKAYIEKIRESRNINHTNKDTEVQTLINHKSPTDEACEFDWLTDEEDEEEEDEEYLNSFGE